MNYKLNKQGLKEYNRSREVKSKKLFCRAPFTNLYFSRNGNIISCCFNREHILGKYPNQNPTEIWNSEQSQIIRKTISKKELINGCYICIREFENKNYHGVIARHFDFLTPEKRYPVMMEFELDNTCNLECIMCEGQFSSSIRKNRDKQEKIPTPYDSQFIDYIEPWLKKAKLLRFGGGEPFLIPLYFDIWDIVLNENPQCKIYVQTNGTVINDKIRKWMASGQFELGVSLDSLNKERFEHIRKNAKLENVLQNIEEFILLMPKKTGSPSLVISATVMRDNWHDVPSLLEYANNKNAQIVFNSVWTPLSCALHNLNSKELKVIFTSFDAYKPSVENNIEKHNATVYAALVQQIKTWMLASVELEQVSGITKSLTTEEIEKYLYEKIIERSTDKITATNKLDVFFTHLRKKENFKEYLLFISRYPVQEIATSLVIHTVEQLKGLIENEIKKSHQ